MSLARIAGAGGGGEVPCRDTDPIPKTPPEVAVMASAAAASVKVDGAEDEASPPTPPTSVPATAFTIDFDDPGTKTKKLGLKDGVRNRLDKRSFREKAAAREERTAAAAIAVDKQNNNVGSSVVADKNVAARSKVPATAASVPPCRINSDQESDAGTYTIDDDSSAVEGERQKIDDVFCVESAEVNSSEWVQQWAVGTASVVTAGGLVSASPAAAVPPSSGGPSPTNSSPTERSATRRKLPATPSLSAAAAVGETKPTPSPPHSTENYLQDTISVMAAMEARIGATETTKKHTTATAVKAAASRKISAQEERKINWERRKNYDPLRAAGKSGSSGRANTDSPTMTTLKALSKTTGPAVNTTDQESCSDSCSDMDRSPYHQNGGSRSSAVGTTPKSLPATRPNRAFALRRKLNSVDEDGVGVSNGAASMARAEAGRSSLRGRPSSAAVANKHLTGGRRAAAAEGRSSSSLSSREAEFQAWKRRKNYNPLRSMKGGASGGGTTKTTSSPLASPRSIMTTSLTSSSPRRLHQVAAASNGHSRSGSNVRSGGKASPRAPVASHQPQEPPMQRSASFHYPDGLHRVPHNVYSSEDESAASGYAGGEDEAAFASLQSHHQPYHNNQVFEVDDDEFILPIGGGHGLGASGSSSRSVRPKMTVMGSGGASGSSGSGSRTSPKRMEALDNLVISTVFSISTKLCASSANLIRSAQAAAPNEEQHSIMDTLLYVLEDTDPPASPAKKTSRELAGTLRNLKKVEQALRALECANYATEDDAFEDDEGDDDDDADDEAGSTTAAVAAATTRK